MPVKRSGREHWSVHLIKHGDQNERYQRPPARLTLVRTRDVSTIKKVNFENAAECVNDGLDLRLHDPCRGALAVQPKQPYLAWRHHLQPPYETCPVDEVE